MGWLFRSGSTRRSLISERIETWERTTEDGTLVKSSRLAHCYRGGSFSGVLWTAWERTFSKDGAEARPTERWIGCDLLRHQKNFGWGYKDLEESMHPYYFSCPLGYLALVPINQYGGNQSWRDTVRAYHEQARERRRRRVTA